MRFAVLSSSCTGSPIGCSDVGAGATENLSSTGLTVGDTDYIRIYDFGSVEPTGSDANSQICVTGTPNSGLPDLTITAGTQYVTPRTVAAVQVCYSGMFRRQLGNWRRFSKCRLPLSFDRFSFAMVTLTSDSIARELIPIVERRGRLEPNAAAVCGSRYHSCSRDDFRIQMAIDLQTSPTSGESHQSKEYSIYPRLFSV